MVLISGWSLLFKKHHINQFLYRPGSAEARGGRHFLLLKQFRGKFMLYVFRPELLRKSLSEPAARKLLARYGYPENGGIGSLICHLSSRFDSCGGFPHEIGIFLDYPPEDVEGFIINKGRNSKLTRAWKVYGDVNRAQERFAILDACREFVSSAFRNGASIGYLAKA